MIGGYAGDILITTSESRVVAEVEVKNVENLDLQLAQALASGSSALLSQDAPRYYLVVSQDKGFLWRLDHTPTLADAPVWELPMGDLLRPYMPPLKRGGRLQFDELRMLVFSCLGDLADAGMPVTTELPAALVESGLADVLRSNAVVITTSADE